MKDLNNMSNENKNSKTNLIRDKNLDSTLIAQSVFHFGECTLGIFHWFNIQRQGAFLAQFWWFLVMLYINSAFYEPHN